VASTKAYVTQVACMLMLALYLGRLKGIVTEEIMAEYAQELLKVPGFIEQAIGHAKELSDIAYDHFKIDDAYFIGRGVDYFTCMEGSLKMKEISYIHSEAFAAGELKHGPIALLDKGTMVIALCTQENVFEKMLSNIKEVKARGAYVLAIAPENHREIESEVDKVLFIPVMKAEVAPIPSVVYLQILAYYLAVARGCDVDKPKNLAKSVTVE
jgi:glucosamine--fructose-6-phosphate aminotransferase (isomerizing)